MKIALLGNTYRQLKINGLITGYSIAASDLIRSFMLYSTAEEIHCLYEPGQYQQEVLENLITEVVSPARREKIKLVSEYDLLFRGFRPLDRVNILHSVKEDAIPLVSIREKIRKPIPITFTMHGLAEQHLMLDTFYPLIYLPFKPYDAVICTSDAVVHTMERMLERLERLNPALTQAVGGHQIRFEKVALGIDTDYFYPMDKYPLRRQFDIPEDAFVILWFGRFSDSFKADLYPLLHVFSQLLKNNPNKQLLLVLAGSQDHGLDYVELLRKSIRHMGISHSVRIIFNDEIENRAQLYALSDVFTSPIDNVQETFGLTPIEAMACGVPQVVSDWDGYRDTVKDGETGFLVRTIWCNCLDDIATADYLPANVAHRRLLQRHLAVRSVVVDCADYMQKLQRLIDDPELAKKMSKNSIERAVRFYDLRITVKKTEQLWARLAEAAQIAPGTFLPERLPMVDYCSDFRDYPTLFLDDNAVFMISKTGNDRLFSDLPQYLIFQKYIEEATLPELILSYISDRKKSMHEITKYFSMFTPDQVKREIMFLYKYGMICVADR